MAKKLQERLKQQDDSDLVGVINPYALAELVLGRTIPWNQIANPRQLLEEALATPYEQLFDPVYESPLYMGLRLNEKLTLERVRPAILDVERPQGEDDLERYQFGDVSALKKVGDLGRYYKTEDIASIPIDAATLVEPGVLKLRISQPGESRLARLASRFTPAILKAILDINELPDLEDITFEPPVSYWGDYGNFFAEAAEFFDPKQGAVANCYLIAAMSAVAWAQPYRIRHLTRATGAGQQQFVNNITLYHVDSHAASEVEVSDAIPLRYSNDQPMYARSTEAGETWPAILEKAYAKWESGASGDTPDIPSTAFGSPSRACAELTGLTRFSVATSGTSADDLWDLVRQNSLGRRTFNPMVASTYSSGASSPDKVIYGDANLVANHAYTVLGWDYRNNKKYIILRNPWASTEATLGSLDATVMMHDISWWRPIVLSNPDGTFALEIGVFKSYFSSLGGAA